MKGPLMVEDLSEYIRSVWLAMESLYSESSCEMPFHGWHHVKFVATNARFFAHELEADGAKCEIAALVHDVNYLVSAQSNATAGEQLRRVILRDVGLSDAEIASIEEIVITAETQVRDEDISREAMALSDADTLFKALPITPVVLAPLYMRETGRTLRQLAEKIVSEQIPLRDNGIYFYSESAKKKYEQWGDVNLALWSSILDGLDDPSVLEVVQEVSRYTGITGQ
jgi:uncharacterized protein